MTDRDGLGTKMSGLRWFGCLEKTGRGVGGKGVGGRGGRKKTSQQRWVYNTMWLCQERKREKEEERKKEKKERLPP